MKTVKSEELKKLLKSQTPVAVFYFMETCPHCIPMHAPWNELSGENPNIKFVKIESADVPSEMGITGFPHFEVLNVGSKKQADGQMSKDELKKKLFGKLGGRLFRRRKTRRLRAFRNTRRVL
jgi:thiol-disulfide isomerase/thioredoxin